MHKCQRCGNETRISTMSMFNTQEICLNCKKREKAHPAYAKALKAEINAVKNGNTNFPGIGKPDDL
jgi:hypothetical protein